MKTNKSQKTSTRICFKKGKTGYQKKKTQHSHTAKKILKTDGEKETLHLEEES